MENSFDKYVEQCRARFRAAELKLPEVQEQMAKTIDRLEKAMEKFNAATA